MCALCLVVAMFPFVLENMDTIKSSKFLVDAQEEEDYEEEYDEVQNEYHKEEKEEGEVDCIPKIIPHIIAMDSLGMHSQTKIGKWIK